MDDNMKAYRAFCGDLCRNFDKPWDQVGKKLDFAYEFLKHIPDVCWRQMVPMAMSRWERWPTNWAKAVLALYKDTQKIDNPIIYNEVEDLRFPVGLMSKAFDILMEDGYSAYYRFAKSVRIPQKDMDRIEFKANACKGGENPICNVNKLISIVNTSESYR